jgi:hypothetical protein
MTASHGPPSSPGVLDYKAEHIAEPLDLADSLAPLGDSRLTRVVRIEEARAHPPLEKKPAILYVNGRCRLLDLLEAAPV